MLELRWVEPWLLKVGRAGVLIKLEMKARWWEMDPSSIISTAVDGGGFGI